MGAQQAVQTEQEAVSKGWTKTPNSFWDLSRLRKTSGETQLICIGLILSNTVSRSRKKGTPAPGWAPLRHSFFVRHTGASEKQIESVLADAHARTLIERKADPDDQRGYLYRATPEKWAKAPRYVPKLVVMKSEPGPEDEPEVAEASIEQRKPRAAFTALKLEPVSVASGEASTPEPIEPGVTQVQFRNEAPSTVEFSQVKSGDTLVVTARIPEVQFGYSESSSDSFQQDTGKRDTRFLELGDKLGPWFTSIYGKPLELAYTLQILKALGASTVDAYLRHCVDEFKVWKRKKAANPPSGMFRKWAQESGAAAKHQAEQQEREEKEAREEGLRRAHAVWDVASDEEREELRRHFPELFGPGVN